MKGELPRRNASMVPKAYTLSQALALSADLMSWGRRRVSTKITSRAEMPTR